MGTKRSRRMGGWSEVLCNQGWHLNGVPAITFAFAGHAETRRCAYVPASFDSADQLDLAYALRSGNRAPFSSQTSNRTVQEHSI